jgi:cell division protease FtsH
LPYIFEGENLNKREKVNILKKMEKTLKNLIGWFIIFAVFIGIYWYIKSKEYAPKELTLTEFYSRVESGDIKEVIIRGNEAEAKGAKGDLYKTVLINDPDLLKFFRSHNVIVRAEKERNTQFWRDLLFLVPFIVFVFFWIGFMRQLQMPGGKAMSFGKSRAKLFTPSTQKITFNDIAGIDEAKEEVKEIIDFLKDPKKYASLGARIPKGVLLVGPPGTGKTLLAKAIAGEAQVPFFSISGSEFVEMFVGVGAARVRDLFEQGKRHAPCIIFIDEIDAVGRIRGSGLGGGHDEREQTLNQLLVEMDGMESNDGIIVIAATNRPDVLDPALLRPGRFDRRIFIPRPDVKGREQILKVHTKNVPLGEDVDLSKIARGTPGFSGADLENMVNEAILIAARKNKKKVEQEDFEKAKDKILMGIERRSMIISEEERKLTAYHESGHVLVAKMQPNADPIHKVTIIPRGMSLGATQQLPLEDKYTYNKEYLIATITVLLGGRAAEELALGTLTTGSGNDLERATEIARKMVCEWGMSERLGPVTFGKREEHIFLGREITRYAEYSEATAIEIDREIKRIVETCYAKAKQIIQENMDKLHKLARALLEKEVLEGHEIDEVLK